MSNSFECERKIRLDRSINKRTFSKCMSLYIDKLFNIYAHQENNFNKFKSFISDKHEI